MLYINYLSIKCLKHFLCITIKQYEIFLLKNYIYIYGPFSKNVLFLGMKKVKNKTNQIAILACLFC
jgi:hypothetical protein